MQKLLEDQIISSLVDAKKALDLLLQPEHISLIDAMGAKVAQCLEGGGKILIAGNGGSLCDAAHFAEELTGQFRKPRRALAAICLGEGGHLTCVANDMGFEHVFARGLEALGKPEDLFIGLSTSGQSQNLKQAFETAQKLGIETVALLGKDGGACRGLADLELIVSGFETSDRIQEAHMTILHIVVEMVESRLIYAN